MKKNLFMVAAVALMALVSCSKEDLTNNGVQGVASDIVFVAESDATKTALGTTTNGVTAVNWVGNETININGVEFSTTSVGPRAEFTTETAFDETAAKFDAIYPSTAGTSLSAVEIPVLQKGTFAEAAISVATSTTTSLKFKNVASILKFQVPANASEVTIESTANLAGTFPVTFDGEGNPVIGQVSNGSKKITLTGSFVVNTNYYVAVLPGSHQFTVKIDGYTSKASTKTSTVERAKLLNMKTLPRNIYLHANTSRYNWTSDGARFATWAWGTGVTASWFNLVAEGHEGVYRFEVPEGYTTLIFCRMNGAKPNNDWANRWNQTANITLLSDMNHFYIYDATSGVWSDNGDGLPTITSESNHIYLKPSANWLEADAHFAAWVWKGSGAGKVYNFKQHPRVPALYEITVPAGSTGMILFRLGPSQNYADNSTTFPSSHWAQSGDLTIGSNNLYTVVNWLENSSKFTKVTSLY